MSNPVFGFVAGAGSQAGNIMANPLFYGIGAAMWEQIPIKPPEIADLRQAYSSGLTERRMLRAAYRAEGFDIGNGHVNELGPYQLNRDNKLSTNELLLDQGTAWNWLFFSDTWNPTIEQSLLLYNRELIDEHALDLFLTRNGVKNKLLKETVIETRFEIPGPSDLIRFSVRGAFDQTEVTSFGYHNETPYEILPWMERQGYGQNIGLRKPAGVNSFGGPDPERNATWFDLYWWAHWELPSLTQGYDMFFRLYSQSDFGSSPDWSRETQFEGIDLEKLQKAQDIPTYWRKRLQAIAYLPLTRVDVRRMYDLGVVTDAEVYHAYRAIGYNDRNAKLLLSFTKSLKDRAEQAGIKKTKHAKICRLYKKGVISQARAIELYTHLKLSPTEILIAIAECDLEWKEKEIDESLKYVKRAYDTGVIDYDGAFKGLLDLGLQSEGAIRYLRIWSLRQKYASKEVAIQRLEVWFDLGILTEQDLDARLSNLGYARQDVARIIREIKLRKLSKIAQALQRKAEKDAQKQTKLFERVEQAAKREREKRRKKAEALVKQGDIGKFKIWYVQGTITEEEIRSRLLLKEWKLEDIERFIIECKNARIEWEKKNAPKNQEGKP